MSAVDVLLEQALRLPERERSELAERLLESLEALEAENDESVAPGEWEAAWSAELDRRVREVREGSVTLVDGDEVLAELDAAVRGP